MPSTYKKNFLSDVVFRIDFPPILEIGKVAPEAFQKEIIADFPILEPVKKVGFLIDTKEVASPSSTLLNSTLWRFKNKTGDLIIELDENFLIIVAKKYQNFSSFKGAVAGVLSALYKIHSSIIVQRLGLRYINQIVIPGEDDFFGWSDYISSDLVKNFDFLGDKSQVRRALQIFEIAVNEDTKLNMRAGVYNSNYPENLSQKEFLLDYDCFTRTPLEQGMILGRLDEYNKTLTDYFEKSITQKFRNLLDA